MTVGKWTPPEGEGYVSHYYQRPSLGGTLGGDATEGWLAYNLFQPFVVYCVRIFSIYISYLITRNLLLVNLKQGF